jgi:hypothetical protein
MMKILKKTSGDRQATPIEEMIIPPAKLASAEKHI